MIKTSNIQSHYQKITINQKNDNCQKITVLLPRSHYDLLDYLYPNNLPEPNIGDIVTVTVSSQKIHGIIWSIDSNNNDILEAKTDAIETKQINNNKDNNIDSNIETDLFGNIVNSQKTKKIKFISERYNIRPIRKEMIELIKFISSYCICPLGIILKHVINFQAINHSQFEFVDLISLNLENYNNKDSDKKREKNSNKDNNKDNNKNNKKYFKLYEIFNNNSNTEIERITLQKQLNYTKQKIFKLIDQNILKLNNIASYKVKNTEKLLIKSQLEYTEEQQYSINYLKQVILNNKFESILLDGVTGSGKTEVYFQAIADLIEHDFQAQVLILIPEIILSNEIVKRFETRFQTIPVIWHSQVSPNTKGKNWLKIMYNNINIVIGTRSSLFLPFANLKLIIVDEEHDSSYKQESGAIFQARDMAVSLAKFSNIPIILGSGTPSLETIVNAQTQKYSYLKLTVRPGSNSLPIIKTIDLKQEKLTDGQLISITIKQSIIENLKNNLQTLLFLNRRGYAPLIICKSCGYKYQCPNCSAYLTHHKIKQLFICHYCEYFIRSSIKCKECNQNNLSFWGPGVEKIESEIQSYFPQAKTIVLTSDTTTNFNDNNKIINQIRANKYNIIIGTQIIAKGHHFPQLATVGIIDADFALSGFDLRAAERTFQILQQVSGRAGREKTQGVSFIQTHSPNHPTIDCLVKNLRDKFYAYEIQQRKNTNSPPFYKMVSIIISGNNDKEVKQQALEIKSYLPNDIDNITILGPATLPIFRVNNQFRYRILIKSPKKINIQKLITDALEQIKYDANILVKVDIDPYSFL